MFRLVVCIFYGRRESRTTIHQQVWKVPLFKKRNETSYCENVVGVKHHSCTPIGVLHFYVGLSLFHLSNRILSLHTHSLKKHSTFCATEEQPAVTSFTPLILTLAPHTHTPAAQGTKYIIQYVTSPLPLSFCVCSHITRETDLWGFLRKADLSNLNPLLHELHS